MKFIRLFFCQEGLSNNRLPIRFDPAILVLNVGEDFVRFLGIE